MASPLSITPSLFPPFACLSYSASARKPFGSDDNGCGVTVPNNSVASSIKPLPLRSSTSQASSESSVVQEIRLLRPLATISKSTPLRPLVKLMPLPCTSMTMGEIQCPAQQICSGEQVPPHSSLIRQLLK